MYSVKCLGKPNSKSYRKSPVAGRENFTEKQDLLTLSLIFTEYYKDYLGVTVGHLTWCQSFFPSLQSRTQFQQKQQWEQVLLRQIKTLAMHDLDFFLNVCASLTLTLVQELGGSNDCNIVLSASIVCEQSSFWTLIRPKETMLSAMDLCLRSVTNLFPPFLEKSKLRN